MRREIHLKKVYSQLLSVTDDGMHLEVLPANDDGSPRHGDSELITIRADQGDARKFVVYSYSGEMVSIPLSEVERIIACAKEEVHSKDFYPFPGS